METLVVSATKAEAAYVPADLPVIVTGVGKVAAASAVAAELTRAEAAGTPYELVVNIGSAGALHDHLEGLHEIGTVLNHDLSADVLREFGYDPQEWLTVGPADGLRLPALLTAAGLTASNSEANRKLKERAVRIDAEVVEDAQRVFTAGFEGVLQVGKRNFARVCLKAS